jgi:adenosylcobinamide-GDP ribazoletransferase
MTIMRLSSIVIRFRNSVQAMFNMQPLKVLKSLLAFLTAIPMKMDENFLQISARFMFLLPIVGALIGVLAGLYAYSVHFILGLAFDFLNSMLFLGSQSESFDFLAKGLAGIMTLAFLLVLTGLQHTDGLVDLGNALTMRQATVEERTKIAHAWIVTRAGAFLALLVALGTVATLFFIANDKIIYSLIVAEVAAKLAMVTCAWQGSSTQKGLGSIFINSMRHKHGLFTVSLATSLIISVFLRGLTGALAVVSGIAIGGLAIFLGKKVFGGVTGDIFGAANEIARMTALFIMVW